jgi:hypothetical protein
MFELEKKQVASQNFPYETKIEHKMTPYNLTHLQHATRAYILVDKLSNKRQSVEYIDIHHSICENENVPYEVGNPR